MTCVSRYAQRRFQSLIRPTLTIRFPVCRRSHGMPSTDTHTESGERSEQRRDESAAGLLTVKTNPLLQWILVNGNRWAVSAVALILVGLWFVGSGVIRSDELVTLFTEGQVVQSILIALFSGIIFARVDRPFGELDRSFTGYYCTW